MVPYVRVIFREGISKSWSSRDLSLGLETRFSERELMFMFAICRRPSVCLSSVCNVRAPYSAD